MASAGDGCLTVSRIRPMQHHPDGVHRCGPSGSGPWWTQVVLPSSVRIDLTLSS